MTPQVQTTQDWNKLTDTQLYNQKTWEIKDITSTEQQINNWNLTEVVNNIKTDSNVWKWTNNPWNIMWDTEAQKEMARKMWAIWFYDSKNWRTYAVFDSMEAWNNAMLQDLQTKLNWWSSWASKNTTLLDFASWWTNWPKWEKNYNATNNFIAQLRNDWIVANQNTKIWDIPVESLWNAIKYNEWTLFEWWVDYSWLKENIKTQDNWPIDSWSWAPIAYARRIKSMVPATLMNSEVELKQLNETIWELYKNGVSAEDAVLTYLWVEFNPDIKDLWINLVDKVRWLNLDPSYYSSLTDLLNKWKIDQAIIKTENIAIQEAQKLNPDLTFSEWWTTFAIKQANNLLDLVNKYESKFWTISWKWENLTKWFFGDKEAQQLATSITQAISKMRNDLVWSNITGWEQWAISELIPKLDESAETAKVKINNLKNTPLLQYNQARESVWLPILNESTLLDINKRKQLYESWEQLQTQTPKSTETNTTSSTPKQYSNTKDIKKDFLNY
jgi:hypothetical protein